MNSLEFSSDLLARQFVTLAEFFYRIGKRVVPEPDTRLDAEAAALERLPGAVASLSHFVVLPGLWHLRQASLWTLRRRLNRAGTRACGRSTPSLAIC